MTVTPEDIAQRLDLRDEPIFTIDSADAKDLDDAICVHKTENGYKLGVHIADVSHYVKAKSAIDNEAYRRGTSVYFADRVIPMLPEALSNGVCSLNAGTEKLTFSALMEFDTQGNMTHYEFRKAVINSKVRGVYSEVNEILAGTASQQLLDKYALVMDSLMAAYELFHVFQKAAEARGNMDLSSDETKFVLDENGVCVQLLPRTTGEAEQLIEQMMIAANIASARAALKAEIPSCTGSTSAPSPTVWTSWPSCWSAWASLAGSCGRVSPPPRISAPFWIGSRARPGSPWSTSGCCAPWRRPITPTGRLATLAWPWGSTATSPRPSAATPIPPSTAF